MTFNLHLDIRKGKPQSRLMQNAGKLFSTHGAMQLRSLRAAPTPPIKL
jgi:hypothetical protein